MNRAQVATLALAVVLILVLGGTLYLVFQNSRGNENVAGISDHRAVPAEDDASTPHVSTIADRITWADLLAGQGPAADYGDRVQFSLIAYLENGTEVFNSTTLVEPFTITLGEKVVAWDEAFIGMKENGVRRINATGSLLQADDVEGDLATTVRQLSGYITKENKMLILEINLISVEK